MDKKEIACPTCKKPGTWTPENEFKPFCSARCKLIDLGDWAAEGHHIPGESAQVPQTSTDEDEDNSPAE